VAVSGQGDVDLGKTDGASGGGVGFEAEGAAEPLLHGEGDLLAEGARDGAALHGPGELEIALQQRG
jgi:hypothetical protein